MEEEPEISDDSKEEEEVKEEVIIDNLEDDETSAPMDYNKKLETEEEIIEDSATVKALNSAINYLDGKSRLVVTWSLGIFLFSILLVVQL